MITVPVRVELILPPLYARLLTARELTFVVEMALSEGEANSKLQAMLDAAIEAKVGAPAEIAAATPGPIWRAG